MTTSTNLGDLTRLEPRAPRSDAPPAAIRGSSPRATGAIASALVVIFGGCKADAPNRRPVDDARPDAAHAIADAGVIALDRGGTDDRIVVAPPEQCDEPPTRAGSDVEVAPEFAPHYRAFALGSVPGVPSPLGGVVVSHDDPNVLLVAGASEREEGAIYSIRLRRGRCDHILGFEGTATMLASTPYVDANLVYGPDGLLVYTEWPRFHLSQLVAGATTPSMRTDLRPLGVTETDLVGDRGPGGIGFVPAGLTSERELRLVTWPDGRWFEVTATMNAGLFTLATAREALVLPNNPGGFAYVPAGSAGFDAQSIILAEWNREGREHDRVAVYESDARGNPMPGTRREFLSRFPRPWGAYFEPLTGDYLFLTWGEGSDRVYLIQGFDPPPELF